MRCRWRVDLDEDWVDEAAVDDDDGVVAVDVDADAVADVDVVDDVAGVDVVAVAEDVAGVDAVVGIDAGVDEVDEDRVGVMLWFWIGEGLDVPGDFDEMGLDE